MPFGFNTRRLVMGLIKGALSLGLTATAFAQTPPEAPDQTPFAPPTPSVSPTNPDTNTPAPEAAPSLPSVLTPPATGVEATESSKAALEDRIHQLESMVNQLSQQVKQMAAQPAAVAGAATADPGAGSTGPVGNEAPGTAAPDTPNSATIVAPSSAGGVGAPGQSLPPNPPANKRFNSPPTLESKKGNVKFGPGFEIRTDDDEFIFQFHNLTQVDYRGYEQGGQSQVRDTFGLPRQWFMFSGRAGRQFGYFVSLANGFDSVTLLDAFIDYDVDPRLRFRVGRFKTPFTYEFLVEPIQGLVVPERSVFFNNFGQNRDVGIMANGRIFDKSVDYAVGIFNGNRNGFVAPQNSKHVSAFLNYHPFAKEEDSILENFNIGGSVYAGAEQQPVVPAFLRTVVPTSGNNILGVPFLGFNSNIREAGFMAFWDLHAAWFYKQWAFVGEWAQGSQSYAPSNAFGTHQYRTRVPLGSFYSQLSYLLTGETRSSIGLVKPNSPFELRKGHLGPGAWEPYVRYEYLDIDSNVFTAGLADPNQWANRLFATHVGLNWHLTQYMKIYFDWNHTEFNQPVAFAANHRQKTSDLFLLRFQLFF